MNSKQCANHRPLQRKRIGRANVYPDRRSQAQRCRGLLIRAAYQYGDKVTIFYDPTTNKADIQKSKGQGLPSQSNFAERPHASPSPPFAGQFLFPAQSARNSQRLSDGSRNQPKCATRSRMSRPCLVPPCRLTSISGHVNWRPSSRRFHIPRSVVILGVRHFSAWCGCGDYERRSLAYGRSATFSGSNTMLAAELKTSVSTASSKMQARTKRNIRSKCSCLSCKRCSQTFSDRANSAGHASIGKILESLGAGISRVVAAAAEKILIVATNGPESLRR